MTPYNRLRLADDLTRPDNPLVRRVIVNRLWERVFGRGLVATTDNLGATAIVRSIQSFSIIGDADA